MTRLSNYMDETPVDNTLDDRLSDLQELTTLLSRDDSDSVTALRLLDGMEAYHQQALQVGLENHASWGLEGYKDIVQRALDTIIRWLKNLKSYLTNFWTTALGTLRSMEYALEHEKLQAESTGVKGGRPLQIQSRVAGLCLRYQPVRDVSALMNAHRAQEQLLSQYYRWNRSVVEPGASRLFGRINQIRAEELSSDQVTSLLHEAQRLSPQQLITTLSLREESPGEYISAPLLNSRRLTVKIRRGAVDDLQGLNGVSIRLEHTDRHPQPIPDTVSFPRFNQTAQIQLLTQLLTSLRLLLPMYANSTTQARVKILDQCTHTTEKWAERSRKLPNGDARLKHDSFQVLQLLRTMADWVNDPYHGLTTNALVSMRSALHVCQLNRR